MDRCAPHHFGAPEWCNCGDVARLMGPPLSLAFIPQSSETLVREWFVPCTRGAANTLPALALSLLLCRRVP